MTGTHIHAKDEAEDLLAHYTQWLEANGIIKLANMPAPAMPPDEETPYEMVVGHIVSRYLELQWGEDREDGGWGHAFES